MVVAITENQYIRIPGLAPTADEQTTQLPHFRQTLRACYEIC